MPVYAEPVAHRDLNGNWLYDPNQQVVFSNRENSRGEVLLRLRPLDVHPGGAAGRASRCRPTTRYAGS